MPTRRKGPGWRTDRIQYRIRCVYQGDPATEEEVLENISRERFIRLGTALGVGATCASLVACGGGAGSSGGGGSGGGDAGGGASSGGGECRGSENSPRGWTEVG